MSDYMLAEASGLTKASVSEFAEQIAKNLNFEPTGDILDFVRRVGGSVDFEDTLSVDPDQSGSLFVEDKGNFRILIPIHTTPNRDRFTVAHELGHYFLHYLYKYWDNPTPPKMKALRKASDRVEWEANWFAAAFLMPSDIFQKKFEEFSGNAAMLASHFHVSESAAEIRIKTLGLQS